MRKTTQRKNLEYHEKQLARVRQKINLLSKSSASSPQGSVSPPPPAADDGETTASLSSSDDDDAANDPAERRERPSDINTGTDKVDQQTNQPMEPATSAQKQQHKKTATISQQQKCTQRSVKVTETQQSPEMQQSDGITGTKRPSTQRHRASLCTAS